MGEKNLLLKLGKKIRSNRLDKQLTQEELSKVCNCEKASISRIESGQSNITIKTLFKISKALDVPIDAFFSE